jgi:hypothetical protein
MNPEERFLERCLDVLEQRLLAEIKRLDDLRAADMLAIQVAQEGVAERMQGFPQQYATKSEQDAIKETAQRLEKSSIDREIYDHSMAQMRESVHGKLEKQVFESTLAEWVTWRRQVEQRLNAASGVSQGITRTFTWAIAGLGALATAVALILNFN